MEEQKDYVVHSLRQGRGQTKIYTLFPGIEISVFHIEALSYTPVVNRDKNILEIMYCISGRVECEMHDGCLQYLGEGDILISKSNNQSQKYELPMHIYNGILISIDLDIYANNQTMLPFSIPINIHTIFENCFIHDSCFLLPTRVATTELFSMKDDISLKRMVSYYQIKVLELLFYLESINLQIEKVEKTYNRMQINIVKNCHDYLIAHIDKKLTISYLATHFCISETTLKAVFKEIYGKPIFAFMKEYRMKQAEHLLLDTSYTIAQVSTMLGYETQSKFGATFKKMVGVSPNEYRNTKQ